MPSPAIYPVICAICSSDFKVGRQRFETSKSFTCSKMCLAELRSRNVIAYRGTSEARVTQCDSCGNRIERKPSQITKYTRNFCGRTCRAIGIRGPNPALITGAAFPCETCGADVWRTPATLGKQVFCSMACTAVGKFRQYGPRVVRVVKPCANGCGRTLRLLPSTAGRGRRFCSVRCAHQTIQGAKRGLPGRPWPEAQRRKLGATIRAKYEGEWSHLRIQRSLAMRGSGNFRYRDGRATRPYAPGWTDRVKMQVAKRDHFKCRLCDAPRHKGTHVVHHIDGEKHDHSLGNLILLCKSCHGKVHADMDRNRGLLKRLNSRTS